MKRTFISSGEMMDEESTKQCFKIMEILKRRPSTYFFKDLPRPNDPDLPNYYKIISRPMAINTVIENLENRKYRKVSEWESDVRLIWDNARKYNPPESPVHMLAKSAAALFVKLKKKMQPTTVEAVTHQYCDLVRKIEKILADYPSIENRPEIGPLKVFDEFKKTSQGDQASGSLASLAQVLNSESLSNNSDQIKVLYILRQTEPKFKSGTNDIKVDITALNDETVEALRNLVQQQQ